MLIRYRWSHLIREGPIYLYWWLALEICQLLYLIYIQLDNLGLFGVQAISLSKHRDIQWNTANAEIG